MSTRGRVNTWNVLDGDSGSDVNTEAEAYLTTELPRLLQMLQETDIRELELQDREVRVYVHRTPSSSGGESLDSSVEMPVEHVAQTGTVAITAPLVGIFYRASQPGMSVLVSEGSHVEPDTLVGVIDSVGIPTDVESGCSGVVTRVLVTEGQPVQYGQPLFEVAPFG